MWAWKYSIVMQGILWQTPSSRDMTVLLEVLSLNSLLHYFQRIHNNDVFELKGVKIYKV